MSGSPLSDVALILENIEGFRRAVGRLAIRAAPLDALRDISQSLVEDPSVASCVVALRLRDAQCPICRDHPPPDPSDEPRLHRLTLAASWGFQYDPELHILERGALFSGMAGHEERTLQVPDLITAYADKLRAAGRWRPDHPHLVELTKQSVTFGLFLPMLLQGEMVGVLSILFRERPREDEVRLYEAFALQAGAALRAAQLLEEVHTLRGRLEEENAYLQHEIEEQAGFAGVVGRSPALREVLRLVQQVAPSESTVLLTGETGTGKELIARAIHAGSRRAGHPLIKVNCGAITPSLVESELFGHEKGAFTGALQRRLGRFELADKGTLFLDEVGELAPETQVKLLRVLQEREFERVGGERQVRVDVRVIAATHRDLPADVAAGRFRADLYYRLNVFPIPVPPLRERREDIPVLAAHFVAHFARALNKPLTGLSRDSTARLLEYDWPGNIRELQNVIERACVLAAGPRVELGPIAGGARPAGAPAAPAPLGTLEAVEAAHVRAVLEATGWRIEGAEGAAEILGLRPSTLRSLMQRLGVRRAR